MKTRRNIYIIIGSLLVILNLLFDLAEFSKQNSVSADQAYNIGYFIGSHILLIIGLIFFRMAYKISRKLKQGRKNEMEESINSIGET